VTADIDALTRSLRFRESGTKWQRRPINKSQPLIWWQRNKALTVREILDEEIATRE
jgi:hypothetical protein